MHSTTLYTNHLNTFHLRGAGQRSPPSPSSFPPGRPITSRGVIARARAPSSPWSPFSEFHRSPPRKRSSSGGGRAPVIVNAVGRSKDKGDPVRKREAKPARPMPVSQQRRSQPKLAPLRGARVPAAVSPARAASTASSSSTRAPDSPSVLSAAAAVLGAGQGGGEGAAGTAEEGAVLYVSTFDVDATPDAVVDYLSAPAGWLVFVPGFAAGCEVVELGDTAAAGFRATTGSNNWMWVTDIATFRREGGGAGSGVAATSESGVGGAGDANGPTTSDGGTVVFTCRITVTDPEEGSPVRPTAHIFTVLQTWTLTPRRFGAQGGLWDLSDAERRGIGGASASSDSGVGGFGGVGLGDL